MASDPDDPPRVKLLCSFGGSVLPRPIDGRLRYVGGETRIVSLPRHMSFDDLMARMRELFDGAHSLKYQQPDEDLDALVSVVNDDDVTNMMEEHDKLGLTGDGFVRLRVFLFPHPSDAAPPFDDERDAIDRRYVDALNCVGADGNPPSPDWGLPPFANRPTLPRRPSHGQLYVETDGAWSPAAAYFSPGQLTPRDHREFSPSPGRLHDYEHGPPSPFIDTGNVVWVPPGGAVADVAGFPGNLGHSHGNVYDGATGCEQCRIAVQRGQDVRYYEARSRHYGPFYPPEQPLASGDVCGSPFVNTCPECVRQRESYLMNQEAAFDHEHFDRPAFYNDFHVRDRNWVAHPHQFGHHPEEVRVGRNEQQYVVDGNAMNFAAAHGGGLYNGSSVSSNYVGYPDSRYAYVGNELNDMYPDPYRALPPLRIPKNDESGIQYGNVASSYGAPGHFQVPDAASSVHGSRRNVYGPAGTGPSYEPLPGVVMQMNGFANVRHPRDLQEENLAFSHMRAAECVVQSGEPLDRVFPIAGVTLPGNALNSNPTVPGFENSPSAAQEPVHFLPTRGNPGAEVETSTLASLPAKSTNKIISDSDGQIPAPVADKPAIFGGAVANDFLRDANRGEWKQDTAMGLDSGNNTYQENSVASFSGQMVGSKENQHQVVDDGNGSNLPVLLDDAIASHPDENKEYTEDRLSNLPELVASVKKIALEGGNDVDAKVQADVTVDASPKQLVDEIPQQIADHENTDQQDDQKDADGDSDNERTFDSKIEATNAEKEALAKGLQAIRNDDLEEIRELGSGAYGSVFHGKWKGTDVAIKRIKASCFAGKPSERERLISDFWKEALILSSLHHPNVVAFYGVVRDGPDGTLATVTEFMINGSLKQFLQKKDRTIDRRKRLIIAMDAAFGMEYLHGKNIVHFDLKCENLLVNMRDPHRPICKIGDLGLSKVKQKTLVSGGVRGTLPWMAPELLSGKSKMVTEKVDVYSFGIVMWELLTGEDPYSDMHCASIIGGIVNGTLRPQIPSWCDPEWKSLMESCWSSEPSERPSFLDISQKLRKMGAAMNLK